MGRDRRDKPIAKKRKFVKDGIFYAELNSFLARELAEDGYAGCEVRVTPLTTEVIIRATRTRNVVGKRMRRIQELTALIQQRFKFKPKGVELYAERVKEKALSGLAQAEAVRYRLFEGLSVRRACYSVLRFVMEHGARGCEVVVSGKLRGQRAKSMKFRDGYLIHSGDAINYYIDTAVKHIKMRQGVLGIKVKIMLPYDPEDKQGGAPFKLPDEIMIKEPKEQPPPPEDKLGGYPPMGGDPAGDPFGGPGPSDGFGGGYGGPSGGPPPGPMGGPMGGPPPDSGYDDQQGGGGGGGPMGGYEAGPAYEDPAAGGYPPSGQYQTPQGPPPDFYGGPQYADPAAQYGAAQAPDPFYQPPPAAGYGQDYPQQYFPPQ